MLASVAMRVRAAQVQVLCCSSTDQQRMLLQEPPQPLTHSCISLVDRPPLWVFVASPQPWYVPSTGQHKHCHNPICLVCHTQPKVPLFINGEFRESKTDKWIELTNPVS